jgi:hypothetical protein
MEKTYQNVGGVMTPQDFKWTHPFRATVVVAGGGGWLQTFPIQAGDECFVIFNDNALDAWRQSGGANNVQLPPLRRHNFADGVAIFRPHSAAVPIPDYNTSSAELRNLSGTIKLTASSLGITVTGNLGVTGNLVVNGTIVNDSTTYSTHVHPVGSGQTGAPENP